VSLVPTLATCNANESATTNTFTSILFMIHHTLPKKGGMVSFLRFC